MISVKSQKMPLIAPEKVLFKCTSCGMEISFYATIVYLCAGCKNPIINVIALKNNPNYRLAYHFGTIDSMGKRVK